MLAPRSRCPPPSVPAFAHWAASGAPAALGGQHLRLAGHAAALAQSVPGAANSRARLASPSSFIRTSVPSGPRSITRQAQVLRREGARWVTQAIFEPLDRRRGGILEGLLAGLAGSLNTVRIYDWRREIRSGDPRSQGQVPSGPFSFNDATIFTDGTGFVVGSGNPALAAGAPRGALSIQTQGWYCLHGFAQAIAARASASIVSATGNGRAGPAAMPSGISVHPSTTALASRAIRLRATSAKGS